jgi:predicted ATPase
LKTISNTNLPRPASSFVGREREVEELAALLRDGARLLTMTGAGGSGKTRLALEAAAELVPEFRNGIFWVGLATLRDPGLVLDTIAQTLGAKNGLPEHIGERELLLLLDNLEQVIEAAPALASLAEACPNLTLLVTSRELLRVRGELEYPVPPLAEPEAVELFCARSGLEPEGTTFELCRRLDNLPLAVELAAARTSVLSPSQILERLAQRLDLLKGGRDADRRQQTLRATIAWSHNLLDEHERRLFARLAVFDGGCTLKAAVEVAEADLDTLQSLVEKSLLRHTDERFWMLETIREYAVERLDESGEADELRRRHAQHFLALAEEAEPDLLEQGAAADSHGRGAWLDRLERELDNLRATLDWLHGSAETQLAMRLAGALSEFWCGKEHVPEGRRRLETAVGADGRPTAARAKALVGAAHMARDSGDAAAARVRAEEALALYRKLGDPHGTAHSTLWLGSAVADEGDFPRARRLFEESGRLFRELGDRSYALFATRMVAWMFYELGDRQRARETHEDNLRRARALGNRDLEATTLGALASYAAEEGRVDDALALASETLCIYRDLGSRRGVAHQLCRCAAALAVAGRAGTAARLLACSQALHEEMGASILPHLTTENEKTLAVIHAQLDDAAFDEAWEQGGKMAADEAVALALGAVDEHTAVSRT